MEIYCKQAQFSRWKIRPAVLVALIYLLGHSHVHKSEQKLGHIFIHEGTIWYQQYIIKLNKKKQKQKPLVLYAQDSGLEISSDLQSTNVYVWWCKQSCSTLRPPTKPILKRGTDVIDLIIHICIFDVVPWIIISLGLWYPCAPLKYFFWSRDYKNNVPEEFKANFEGAQFQLLSTMVVHIQSKWTFCSSLLSSLLLHNTDDKDVTVFSLW